jgi:hypothetical protein
VGLCRKCDGLSRRARRPACRDHTLRHICVIASGADIGEHPITPFGPVGSMTAFWATAEGKPLFDAISKTPRDADIGGYTAKIVNAHG